MDIPDIFMKIINYLSVDNLKVCDMTRGLCDMTHFFLMFFG
jgi:hypothetical protein